MQPNLAAVLALGLGFYAPVAIGASDLTLPRQTIAVKEHPESALLAFQGLTVASFNTSADGMEIALTFNEPVQESVARELAQLLNSIADASTGYDSLLMRVRTASTFELQESSGGFSLQVRPLSDRSNAAQATQLEIRRHTLLDDTEKARALLTPLRASQPQDVSLLRLDADIDYADRNYRSAASKYEQILALSPEDQAAKQSLYAARTELAPRIESGLETRKIERADQQLRAFAAGEIPLNDGLTLRGRIDFVSLDDNAVQSPDGSIAPFDGNKYAGELGLSYDFGTRWFANLSIHGAEETLGTSASIEYRDAASEVKLTAGYHQPSWDYPETIIADGTFDHLGLMARKSFDDSWFVNVGLALRRYALAGEEDAATTSTVEAGIRWAIPWDYKTQLTLGYAFDAEYAHSIALRPDGGGGFYALVPAGDRAMHIADVRVVDQLTEQFLASAFAGYARDNEGSNGIVAGAELTYTPETNLRIALNAYYSGISDRIGESGAYMHAGITVTRLLAPANGSNDEQ